MAQTLRMRVRKVNKVYDPDFYNSSPNLMMDGVFLNKAVAVSNDDDDSAPKRKIKARIRMDVEIR